MSSKEALVSISRLNASIYGSISVRALRSVSVRGISVDSILGSGVSVQFISFTFGGSTSLVKSNSPHLQQWRNSSKMDEPSNSSDFHLNSESAASSIKTLRRLLDTK